MHYALRILYVLAYGSHVWNGLGRSAINNPHYPFNYAFLIMNLLPDTRTSVRLYVRVGLPAVWIPNNYELCIMHYAFYMCSPTARTCGMG